MLSQEGTTQGDNLAMSFYGLSTSLLINRLANVASRVKQVWLSDDPTGAGSLLQLLDWWNTIISEGKIISYNVNESKSWLILKNESDIDTAKEIFTNTAIQLTTSGKRHLGAAIGNQLFKDEYVGGKITEWRK